MNNIPSPPSLRSLSPVVLDKFNSLSGGAKHLFRTVFYSLWRYLWPVSKIDALGFGYAVPFVLAQEEIHLGQFWMMARLWVLSASGSQAVNTHHYKMDKTQEHKNIRSLVDLGFLIRTSFDPAHPYAVRPSHIQRTYISFTPAGVRYYKSVVEKVNRYVRDDVLRLAESVTKERPNGNTLGP